jgi:hypothetical protein
MLPKALRTISSPFANEASLKVRSPFQGNGDRIVANKRILARALQFGLGGLMLLVGRSSPAGEEPSSSISLNTGEDDPIKAGDQADMMKPHYSTGSGTTRESTT